MAPEDAESQTQRWEVHFSMQRDTYSLSRQLLGPEEQMDAYRDGDLHRVRLGRVNDERSQSWLIVPVSDGGGRWRVTNLSSGPDLALDVVGRDEVVLTRGVLGGNEWVFERVSGDS